MAELLKECNLEDWEIEMLNSSEEILHNTQEVASRILSLYGGMGSFSDIILYADGSILVRENIEFDKLRNRLHDLCLDCKANTAVRRFTDT